MTCENQMKWKAHRGKQRSADNHQGMISMWDHVIQAVIGGGQIAAGVIPYTTVLGNALNKKHIGQDI